MLTDSSELSKANTATVRNAIHFNSVLLIKGCNQYGRADYDNGPIVRAQYTNIHIPTASHGYNHRYAISSLISLLSLDAAFAIDAIRDIYEASPVWLCGGLMNNLSPLQAFVIYAFFNLMINYLGGERSLLILLYGRPPKHHVFPVSLFKSELDASDPFTFLFLKRGILR